MTDSFHQVPTTRPAYDWEIVTLAEAFFSDYDPASQSKNLNEVASMILARQPNQNPAPPSFPNLKLCQWPLAKSSFPTSTEKSEALLGGFFVLDSNPSPPSQSSSGEKLAPKPAEGNPLDASGNKTVSTRSPYFTQWNHIIPGKMAVMGQPSMLRPKSVHQVLNDQMIHEPVRSQLLKTIETSLNQTNSKEAEKEKSNLGDSEKEAPIRSMADEIKESNSDTAAKLRTYSTLLMSQSSRWLMEKRRAGEVEMAQVVLPFRDAEAAIPYIDAGFVHLADLIFLASPVGDELNTDGPINEDFHFDIQPVSDQNLKRWAKVLESTYKNSMDAPELTGKRSMLQTLIGYCHTGNFRPEGWAICQGKDKLGNPTDLGCVILCEHQNSSYLELVYFGVSDAARGKGVGREIFRFIHQTAKMLGKERVVAAVDISNQPAINIYNEFQYQLFDQKTVLVHY